MNFLSYLRVELSRIFLSRMTWMVMLLTLAVPLVGYGLYQPSTQLAVTRSGEFIGNPTLAGAVGGVILFALLTLFELDRVHKSGSDKLTDTIVSPVTMYLTRMLSVLAVATSTGILATVIYLPYTLYKVGYLFDWSTYLGCWLLIFLPALWIGSLLAAVFYQITRRMDISLVLVIFAAVPCFAQSMHYEFILRWINPDVPFLSDMFGNSQPLRMAAYNRIFWLAALTGLYIISWLCVRRYGRGLFGSLLKNGKKFYKPIVGIACIVLAVNMYITQPFVSRAAPGIDPEMAAFVAKERISDNRLTPVDVYTLLEPNLQKGKVTGYTTWQFAQYTGLFGDSLPSINVGASYKMYLQINSGWTVSSVVANGVDLDFTELPEEIQNFKFITFDLPSSMQELAYSRFPLIVAGTKGIELTIEYGGQLKIWRENEQNGLFGTIASPYYLELDGLPPDLWAMHPRGAMVDHHINVVDVVLPANMVMINHYATINSNYLFQSPVSIYSKNEDGTNTWRYSSNSPLSRRPLYAADYIFERIELDGNGRSIDVYYARKNKDVMEKYNALDILKAAYDYCTEKIALPSGNNGVTTVLLQNRGAGEMQFSEDSLINQWRAGSGRDSYATEIISEWWNSIRFVSERNRSGEQIAEEILREMQGEPLLNMAQGQDWNSAGLVEYIAYCYTKETFGEDIAKDNYINTWKKNIRNYHNNFYTRNPEYMKLLPQRHINMLAQNVQEALLYSGIALKIHKAAQLIGGEDKMIEIISGLFQTAIKNPEWSAWAKSDFSVEDFWETQSIDRPTGKADEYFTSLYGMLFGQKERPENGLYFSQSVPVPNDIFIECGMNSDEPLAVIITDIYFRLINMYGDRLASTLAYTDFLEACGLAAEDLELTEEDFKI